ncbi:MAG: hypothetical protein RI513_04005 [Balneolaceae bacterium]|nr:hypothetical protein [Balneolaceae bacterium]
MAQDTYSSGQNQQDQEQQPQEQYSQEQQQRSTQQSIMVPKPPVLFPEPDQDHVSTTLLDDTEITPGVIPRTAFERPDSAAYPYEVLLHRHVITFEIVDDRIVARLQVQKRVRLQTEDPQALLDASLVTIPLSREREDIQVVNLSGVTVAPNGTHTYLSLDDIRQSQFSKDLDVLEFVMPNVTDGVVMDIQYERILRRVDELPDVSFSDRVPVHQASVHLISPNYIRYQTKLQDPNNRIRLASEVVDTSSVIQVFSIDRPDPLRIDHWIGRAIPAEEFDYVSIPSPDEGTAIRFMMGEFGIPRQPLENSWAVVEAQLRRLVAPYERSSVPQASLWRELGAEIEQSGPQGKANAPQRLHAMIDTLHQKVTVQSTPSIVPDDVVLNELFRSIQGVDKQGSDKQGVDRMGPDRKGPDRKVPATLDSVGLKASTATLAFMAMAQGAGYKVIPHFMNDGRFGDIDQEFPSVQAFRTMVLLVEDPRSSQQWWVQPSDPWARVPYVDASLVERTALTLHPEGYRWTTVNSDELAYGSTFTLDGRLTMGGEISGKVTIELEGFAAKEFLERLETQPLESLVRRTFLDRYPTSSYSSLEFTNRYVDSGVIRAQFDVILPDVGVQFVDQMDIPAMIFGALEESPYQAASRKTSIYVRAKERVTVSFQLQLPQNWSIAQAPIPSSLQADGVRFEANAAQSGSSLIASFDLERSQSSFSPDAYPTLRQAFQRWVVLSQARWTLSTP